MELSPSVNLVRSLPAIGSRYAPPAPESVALTAAAYAHTQVGKYDWEVIQTESGEAWSRCLDMVW